MAYYASVWNKDGDTSKRLVLLSNNLASVASLPSGYSGTLASNFGYGNCDAAGNKKWSQYRDTIVEVIIAPGTTIVPKYCDRLFYGLTKLTTITNITSIHTSNTTNMYYMFSNCSSLTSLDLSNFDTSKVTVMGNMFSGCSGLTTIYVNEDTFKTDNVTSSSSMFKNCTSIVGQNGTTYNANYIDKTYARIDKSGTPGYFSEGKRPIYFNSNQINNVYFNGTKVTGDVYFNGTKIT